MKQPLVSAIIPNYNYERFIADAIESALKQTYPYVEVIVVDDGSTDMSQTVTKNYEQRIRSIRQENKGVAAARNRGVEESRGELLAFLDADDLWLPTKLERQVQLFLADDELGLVHCGVEEMTDAGERIRLVLKGMEGWVARELLLLRQAVILGGGSGLMVPRRVFDAVGGFDQRLSTSADWDLFYRVAAKRKVGFVPEPLVRYRLHDSNMHSNVQAMAHDMLLGFEKAFSDDTAELRQVRRVCYGNLHMMLAGSFFRARLQTDFLQHALKSLWFAPTNINYLLAFPFRRQGARAGRALE